MSLFFLLFWHKDWLLSFLSKVQLMHWWPPAVNIMQLLSFLPVLNYNLKYQGAPVTSLSKLSSTSWRFCLESRLFSQMLNGKVNAAECYMISNNADRAPIESQCGESVVGKCERAATRQVEQCCEYFLCGIILQLIVSKQCLYISINIYRCQTSLQEL